MARAWTVMPDIDSGEAEPENGGRSGEDQC